MSANSTLEPVLQLILQAIVPNEEDRLVRWQILNDLCYVVGLVERLRGATVEPCGSFASNHFSWLGDLDVSIEIPNGSHISSPGKERRQTLLADLLNALSELGGWHSLELIDAHVSVLECKYLDISCNIFISNLSGQLKARILFWLRDIDFRFRDLVLLVEEWAKTQGINDPKSGSFNSYCLNLLVIYHLQTCIPAILPPLKDIYPGNIVDDLIGGRMVAVTGIQQICAENINRFNRSKKVNRAPLSELFVSFLEKYRNITDWAQEYGVSIYSGHWGNIATNMKWQPKNYALLVEDPFEQPVNTARTVSHRQLQTTISEAFQWTYHQLKTNNRTPNSIVPFLVRSDFLPRMIVHDPSVGYAFGVHPRINRPNHTNSPAKRQTEKFWRPKLNGEIARVDKQASANGNNQRPAQGFQIQEEKAWRPILNAKKAQVDKQASADGNTEMAQGFQIQEQKVLKPILNGKEALVDKQVSANGNTQRPAQGFQIQEHKVWRPIMNAKKAQVDKEASADGNTETAQDFQVQEQKDWKPIVNAKKSQVDKQASENENTEMEAQGFQIREPKVWRPILISKEARVVKQASANGDTQTEAQELQIQEPLIWRPILNGKDAQVDKQASARDNTQMRAQDFQIQEPVVWRPILIGKEARVDKQVSANGDTQTKAQGLQIQEQFIGRPILSIKEAQADKQASANGDTETAAQEFQIQEQKVWKLVVNAKKSQANEQVSGSGNTQIPAQGFHIQEHNVLRPISNAKEAQVDKQVSANGNTPTPA